MRVSVIAIAAAVTAWICPAQANDTMAQLHTGGLVFVTSDTVEMASEELSISAEQVKVVYRFHNKSAADQHVLVAFPMPDIQGSLDFLTALPTKDPVNIFGFKTTFNGKPVDATLHQYAFHYNIDYSDVLRGLGVPLTPFGDATNQALNALPAEKKHRLEQLGLISLQQFDEGHGWHLEAIPLWTLHSAYSWEAIFPAGKDAIVVHTYTPSVGGIPGITFLPHQGDPLSTEKFAEYKTRYCLDEGLVGSLKKSADGQGNVPYSERWLSYVWITGENWAGPVGKFTLTVDKGDTRTLLSFCGDNVKKIGPKTFQMTSTDWQPPSNTLEILLLSPLPQTP